MSIFKNYKKLLARDTHNVLLLTLFLKLVTFSDKLSLYNALHLEKYEGRG